MAAFDSRWKGIRPRTTLKIWRRSARPRKDFRSSRSASPTTATCYATFPTSTTTSIARVAATQIAVPLEVSDRPGLGVEFNLTAARAHLEDGDGDFFD